MLVASLARPPGRADGTYIRFLEIFPRDMSCYSGESHKNSRIDVDSFRIPIEHAASHAYVTKLSLASEPVGLGIPLGHPENEAVVDAASLSRLSGRQIG